MILMFMLLLVDNGNMCYSQVSGVLAVVVGGLYMSFYGRPRISPSVQVTNKRNIAVLCAFSARATALSLSVSLSPKLSCFYALVG